MPEVWTAPFIAVTNDIIASSDANAGYRGNLLWIRQFLSANPSGANEWLQSTSADGASWVSRAAAVLAALGFTPVNKAGDTMSGALTFSDTNEGVILSGGSQLRDSTGAELSILAHAGRLVIYDATDVSVMMVIEDASNTLTFKGSTIWRAANDGAGSGLDADLLDGLQAAAFLQLTGGTMSGNILLVNTAEIQAITSGGTPRAVLVMTAGNVVNLGHASHALALLGSALTFAGNPVWHAGNDGAGSGLDADSIDGLDSTALARLGATSNFTTPPTINSNTVWHAGNDGAGSGLDADSLDGVSWKQGLTGEFSGSHTLTTSYADLSPSCQFTADRNGQWLVLLVAEFVTGAGDGQPGCKIVAGGVDQEEGLGVHTSGLGGPLLGPAVAMALVTVSGSTTIKAQVKKASGSATSNCVYSKISGVWLAP